MQKRDVGLLFTTDFFLIQLLKKKKKQWKMEQLYVFFPISWKLLQLLQITWDMQTCN